MAASPVGPVGAPDLPPPGLESPWSPLRHRVYRALWIAQFASNVGTWMQTVGAQWLMGSLSDRSFLVALVQTATSLPFLISALPGGAAGDIFDRRRLLLGAQTFMLVAATSLAALTLAGATTPSALLVTTFVLGLAQALMWPTWQALQMELVERYEISQAAALGGVSQNAARAIGPAIGGAVVAAVGPGWVFALNAVSFVGVLAVIVAWRPVRRRARTERFGVALVAGWRYARGSTGLRRIMVRAGLFGLFAGGIWALLPILARADLHLGSGGYGLLLGEVGVGAIFGAWLLPRLRAALTLDRLIVVGSIAFGLGCIVLTLTRVVVVSACCVGVMGLAWIVVLGSLNGSAQRELPDRIRSRGMSLYMIVVQGSQALSSVAWGLVAELADARWALAAMGTSLAATALMAPRRWSLYAPTGRGP